MASAPPDPVVTGDTCTLPRSIAALEKHWRELPPTLTIEQVLDAGWLPLSRSPMYRAIAAGQLPAVRLGRRTFLLTTPLLRMLGLELDDCP